MPFNTFFKTYKNNTDGNFAIIFAVSLLMIIAVVGAALDFTMIQSSKVKIQNTADAAVLAAAKSGETAQPALLSVAQNVVNANNQTGGSLVTDLSLTNNGRIRVNVSGQYNTHLMGIFGQGTVDIEVVSEAPLGSSDPVNIALVLDVTGSMHGAKLVGLKSAANNLITMLESQENANVKVSVVPFAQYVNVGSINVNQPWMQAAQGWSGCAGSRSEPLDMQPAYSGQAIPGLAGVNCGAPLLPLSNNFTSIRAKINSLQASGWTYIPAGLIWGWRTLEGSAPFGQGVSPAPNTKRVMIVMTDGANTKSKSGFYHTGHNMNAANQKTGDLCSDVKSGNIEIYTIAYAISNNATKTLMRNCATETNMYFDAANAAQLNAAFQEIGKSLVNVRLTH